ncbi:hypothetical protein GIB67_014908, partial [Kingdonia uniflora]
LLSSWLKANFISGTSSFIENIFMLRRLGEVGDVDFDAKRKYSKKIVDKCDGLPLAIGTLARTLIKKEGVWIAVIQQLKKSMYESLDLVNASIKMSYDFLKLSKTKLCFLLYALFPEDHKVTIDALVGYTMGEDFLGDVEALREARGNLYLMETLFSVGMVCCDAEGRLNENSILLQGSAEQSGGQNVRFDLQKLTQFSFFPGQVVGIEGHNPKGYCLIVSKVVDSIPLTVSSDLELQSSKKLYLNNFLNFQQIVTAGPFTTTDNLLFQPLIELLAYASKKQPQLVMLLGPFVYSKHLEIKRGAIDKSFDDIFHVEILRRLQDYTEYMGSASQVILVPSIRDASHDFVFPLPTFDIDPSELHHQVKIGCRTLDILKHLSSEEISRISTDGTRDHMRRLVIHVLKQRMSCSSFRKFKMAMGFRCIAWVHKLLIGCFGVDDTESHDDVYIPVSLPDEERDEILEQVEAEESTQAKIEFKLEFGHVETEY